HAGAARRDRVRSHRRDQASLRRVVFGVNPRHVYIHVPFCGRRCTYCDFAIAVRKRIPVDDYVASIAAELDLRFPTREPWVAETLYFGGGTPSRLRGEGIARLMDVVRKRITLA